MHTEVLVVGAGPTGLVLALWLARLGIRVRIIDKAAGPGGTSRALAVQARTLELYRQLGFANEVIHAGLKFTAANLWAIVSSGPLLYHVLHVSIDESDVVAVFPLKDEGRVRLICTIRPGAEKEGEQLGWKDVSTNLLQRLRIDVRRVNWFSTYHVHHRVAARFRQGRVFLLGDAAHIHSPVGGQGMNTGIGDAVNLAWKLAAALRGRAPERILHTYEPERT